MRIARRNVGLALGLGGLVAILIALEGTGSGQRAIGRLFPAVSETSARRVILTDPQATAPGNRLELARDAQGIWTLPEHLGYPARESAVQALFTGLTSLTNLDLLASEAESHDRYGVGDSGLEILVLGENETRLAGLLQGAGADAAGRSSYVRPMGGGEVYRAPYLPRQKFDPTTWIDTRFLAFQSVVVQAIAVRGTDLPAPFRLVRDGLDRWKLEEGEAAPARIVTELLERAASLFFDAVVELDADSTAFGQPALELTLELADETTIRAVFAEQAADGTRLARRDGSEWVVRFGSSAYDLILEAVRALAPDDQ